MYHSITFGEKNTWDDWHLIPTSRPVVNPPAPKTHYVEIPGADGDLDLTTNLDSRPRYKNRTGSFDFYADPDYMDWATLYSEIMVYLQGQSLKMVLEDDPNYYYEGRYAVNQWKSDPQRSTIVINYTVGPYKKEVNSVLDDWKWDVFNFENGIIREYKEVPIGEDTNICVIGTFMPLTAIITASNSGCTVTFKGVTYRLAKGKSVIKDIVIVEGRNDLLFNGSGTVSISYTGGTL